MGDQDWLLLTEAAISQVGLHLTYLLGASGTPQLCAKHWGLKFGQKI